MSKITQKEIKNNEYFQDADAYWMEKYGESIMDELIYISQGKNISDEEGRENVIEFMKRQAAKQKKGR